MQIRLMTFAYLLSAVLIMGGIYYWMNGLFLYAVGAAGLGLWIAASMTYGVLNWRRIQNEPGNDLLVSGFVSLSFALLLLLVVSLFLIPAPVKVIPIFGVALVEYVLWAWFGLQGLVIVAWIGGYLR